MAQQQVVAAVFKRAFQPAIKTGGRANQVIERLIEEIEILRPDHIAIQIQLGDFDQKTMLKQMELWGDTIIPAVKKAVGDKTKVAAAVE